MLNKNDIFRLLKENSNQFKKFAVTEIGLFGSYLTGKAKEDSDIDILVDIENDKENFDNFISLCYYSDGIFKGKKLKLLQKTD
jgi:uncharacterized protein